jgi:hypothetical protein
LNRRTASLMAALEVPPGSALEPKSAR